MKEKIKNWFSTSKRTAIFIACFVGVLAIVMVGAFYSEEEVLSVSISEEEALSYAADDAGVDATLIEDALITMDEEAGQSVYEVEFTYDGVEYDYELLAEDGTIIKKETDIVETLEAATSDEITLAEAKEIALADAGIDEVTYTKAELDTDEDEDVYDIQFYTDDMEYEYEIAAIDGEIVEKSTEARDTKSSETITSYIGLTKAKAIALADAGVDEVTYTKAELDNDDGTKVYDLEFYTATMSYEYEINALTGAILEKDSDKINTSSSSSSASSTSMISLEEAKSIALAKVGLSSSEVTFTKAKLDKDDGIQVYEIEFTYGNYEYEFEINATSATIIEWEKEIDD